MALCCGAQWVWGTVCEGLEHPWIWAFWAGDFLEPAPHGMRGDLLEQSWETGIWTPLPSALVQGGSSWRRLRMESGGAAVSYTAPSPDRAVGVCGPGAQHGVAVGIPALVLRVLASVSPDLWSWTPAPALSFMCFHSLLRPATQFYSFTLPLWPTSRTLPLWALAMISFPSPLVHVLYSFCVGTGRSWEGAMEWGVGKPEGSGVLRNNRTGTRPVLDGRLGPEGRGPTLGQRVSQGSSWAGLTEGPEFACVRWHWPFPWAQCACLGRVSALEVSTERRHPLGQVVQIFACLKSGFLKLILLALWILLISQGGVFFFFSLMRYLYVVLCLAENFYLFLLFWQLVGKFLPLC